MTNDERDTLNRRIDTKHKACPKCREVKPSSGFYQDASHKDGLQSHCIECRKLHEQRPEIRRQIRKGQRTASQKPSRKDKRRVYEALISTKRIRAASVEKYRKANPEKRRANGALNWQIRSGKMQRLPCEVCGDPKSDAHHDDYGKPLEVRWLCRQCHMDHHRAQRGQHERRRLN